MKKKSSNNLKLFITVISVFLIIRFDTSQVTYTWVGGSSGNFTTAANWSPVRANGQVSDILRFNCGGTVNALNVQQQTIGQLLITGSTHVIFTPASGNSKVLSINGGTGDDFLIEQGSTIEINGTSPVLGFLLKTGATGSVSGTVIINGSSAHYLNAMDINSLVFHSGSSCIQSSPGAVFTNGGTANAVFFEDGSSFVMNGTQSLSPFGLTPPYSKVVFSTNSTCIFQQPNAAALKFGGRNYGNLSFNFTGNMTVNDTMSGNVSLNNITINSGANVNINNVNTSFVSAFSIHGNLIVNGSINFTNNKSSVINFNGSNNQIISGSGTILLPTTFVFSNVYLNECRVTSNTIVTENGSVTPNHGYIIGTLTKHFSSTVNTQNFEVGTANGYSPLTITINNVVGSGQDIFNYSLTVSAVPNVYPLVPDSTAALKRYWTIKNNGLEFDYCNINFHYLPGDFNNSNFTIQENESSMLNDMFNYIMGNDYKQQKISLRDTVNHVIGIIGVSSFGDFTNLKNIKNISNSNISIPNSDLYNKGTNNAGQNYSKTVIPSQFGISQNYPNPFNPTTKIDYQLPYASKVAIILYDLTGKEIEKLVDSNQDAGTYTIQVDGSKLSSGVYFYKIEASSANHNYGKALKMILAK